MKDVPAQHQHCFDMITHYCVNCGQSETLLAKGLWSFHCPGTGKTNLIAISHLVRAKRLYSFARKAFADAYCGA